jgi:hypothetical protein
MKCSKYCLTGFSLISLMLVILTIPAKAQDTSGLPTSVKTDPLTYLSSGKWQTNEISVCWENPGNNNATERSWVRTAIAPGQTHLNGEKC